MSKRKIGEIMSADMPTESNFRMSHNRNIKIGRSDFENVISTQTRRSTRVQGEQDGTRGVSLTANDIRSLGATH